MSGVIKSQERGQESRFIMGETGHTPGLERALQWRSLGTSLNAIRHDHNVTAGHAGCLDPAGGNAVWPSGTLRHGFASSSSSRFCKTFTPAI